jgi:hypothetical protein
MLKILSLFSIIPTVILALVALQTTFSIELVEYKHNLRGVLQGKGDQTQARKFSRLVSAYSDAIDDYIENQQFDLGLEMNLTRGKKNRAH